MAHNANQNWLIAVIEGFFTFLFGNPAGVLRGSEGQGDDFQVRRLLGLLLSVSSPFEASASKDSLGSLWALTAHLSQKMLAQGQGRVNSPACCSIHITGLLKHELRLGPGFNLLLLSSGPH